MRIRLIGAFIVGLGLLGSAPPMAAASQSGSYKELRTVLRTSYRGTRLLPSRLGSLGMRADHRHGISVRPRRTLGYDGYDVKFDYNSAGSSYLTFSRISGAEADTVVADNPPIKKERVGSKTAYFVAGRAQRCYFFFQSSTYWSACSRGQSRKPNKDKPELRLMVASARRVR